MVTHIQLHKVAYKRIGTIVVITVIGEYVKKNEYCSMLSEFKLNISSTIDEIKTNTTEKKIILITPSTSVLFCM